MINVRLEPGRSQWCRYGGEDARRLRDLREDVYFEVWRKWVWETHVARESREDEVAHLYARCRDDIAQREVVVTEKFRKIVKKYELRRYLDSHAIQTCLQQMVSMVRWQLF